MSRQQEQAESNLIQSISQQLNLYDNLFPQVDNKELQVLFALLRIYLARCDNPQLKREHIFLNPQLTRTLFAAYLDPFSYTISRSMKDALISRLNSIRKYRITSPEVVRRTLATCFFQEEGKAFTKRKIYLNAFMKNPAWSFTETAMQLGVTPQAVSKAYRSLQKSDSFRFYGLINYPIFKLRHLIVFFSLMKEYKRSSDYLRRLFMDELPFIMSLNIDVSEGSSWASFAIPNQNKELDEFKGSLNQLRGEIFREVEIRELRSFSTGSNLEFFDGKKWFFDPQLWAYGFFEFVRENKEILTRATEFPYSKQPKKFDRIDFAIAASLASNPLIPQCEIRKQLVQLGYGISRPTITRRVRKLFSSAEDSDNGEGEQGSQDAIYPYMTYWGLGLNNMSSYLIECEQEQLEELHYAVNYLPYYFLYNTDRGALLFVKSMVEDATKISYMIKGIDDINVVAYSNRYENVGTRTLTPLYELWDETKQRWLCPNRKLDFVKRYESLS